MISLITLDVFDALFVHVGIWSLSNRHKIPLRLLSLQNVQIFEMQKKSNSFS